MADKGTLGILGLVFAAITAAVMLTAVIVVREHIEGRVVLDGGQTVASIPATSTR